MKLFRKKRLTPERIRELYRQLLGRDVEEESVISSHMNGHSTEASLRETILASPEYHAKRANTDLWQFLSTNVCRPAPRIEVEVSDEQLKTFFYRINKQWSTLGNSDAHWSVVTDEKFRKATFAEHEAEFFASGRHVASLIDLFAHRNGVVLDKEHLVELGCGTGRSTAALAESFEKVTAVDVSSGHLDLCRETMAKRQRSNVDFLHLQSPTEISTLPECSFLFSAIVLQHNPPPLIRYFLDKALSKVRSRGAALFQVPTHTAEYEFRASDYLASEEPRDFEMHCFPMHEVFSLLHRHGFMAHEVIMDAWTGMPGSHIFFATKL